MSADTSLVLQKRRKPSEAPRRGEVERGPVLLGSVPVERGRVRLPKVVQAVGEGVHDQLILAETLLGFLFRAPRPGIVGRAGLPQEVALVRREEVELPLEKLVEPSP